MTKCLFVTCVSDDYGSACIWDGLQEVLGQENVYDVGFTSSLHSATASGPTGRIGGYRIGPCLTHHMIKSFDLLVINTSFRRDHSWDWLVDMKRTYCRPDCKVAYIEANDNWDEVNGLPFVPDAVFRREMAQGGDYQYGCPVYNLMFAAPRRWFEGAYNANRTYDVFGAISFESNPLRWDCLPKIFQTQTRHRSIIASCSVGFDSYFDYMRSSKLTVCPPGAGSDCMRQWEAIACGSIPLFVGHGGRVRENWFRSDMIFEFGDLDLIPRTIDHALRDLDLNAMRERMLDHALTYHTTAARAKRLLAGVGL